MRRSSRPGAARRSARPCSGRTARTIPHSPGVNGTHGLEEGIASLDPVGGRGPRAAARNRIPRLPASRNSTRRRRSRHRLYSAPWPDPCERAVLVDGIRRIEQSFQPRQGRLHAGIADRVRRTATLAVDTAWMAARMTAISSSFTERSAGSQDAGPIVPLVGQPEAIEARRISAASAR